jgi:hypothetical protein
MPNENLTTYVEADPNGHIEAAVDRVTFTGLSYDESAYLYKDKGAGHFGGDFEHRFQFMITGSTNFGRCHPWMTANAVGDWLTLHAAAEDNLALRLHRDDPDFIFRLFEDNDLGWWEDTLAGLSENTMYYVTVKRDEAVGTYGTLYCYVYLDEGRTNLFGTLSLALRKAVDFQYVYALSSEKSIYPDTTVSGYVESLDLMEQEAASLPSPARTFVLDTAQRAMLLDTERRKLRA